MKYIPIDFEQKQLADLRSHSTIIRHSYLGYEYGFFIRDVIKSLKKSMKPISWSNVYYEHFVIDSSLRLGEVPFVRSKPMSFLAFQRWVDLGLPNAWFMTAYGHCWLPDYLKKVTLFAEKHNIHNNPELLVMMLKLADWEYDG